MYRNVGGRVMPAPTSTLPCTVLYEYICERSGNFDRELLVNIASLGVGGPGPGCTHLLLYAACQGVGGPQLYYARLD
jgi:hypothetical protein